MSETERRYLVLVVGMLVGPGPAGRIYELSKERAARFHFIVPPTKPDYGLTWTESQAHDDAEQRLQIILDFAVRMGLRATGEVSETADPVDAVRAVAQDFDEVIVVDNPRGLARWHADMALADLHMDPGLPVQHFKANPATVQGKHFDMDHLKNEFEKFLADLKRTEASQRPT